VPATEQAPSSAAVQAADAAVASAVQQAQAEAEGARAGTSGSLAEHPASGVTSTDATLSQVLSVEWVDAVVQEMMSARDLDDARQRAGRFLQNFGSAVLEKAAAVQVQHLPRPLPTPDPSPVLTSDWCTRLLCIQLGDKCHSCC